MKRRYYIIILLLSLVAAEIRAAVGHPFFVNFTTADYGAHNRNFDILSDDNGRVYVANFEALLRPVEVDRNTCSGHFPHHTPLQRP